MEDFTYCRYAKRSTTSLDAATDNDDDEEEPYSEDAEVRDLNSVCITPLRKSDEQTVVEEDGEHSIQRKEKMMNQKIVASAIADDEEEIDPELSTHH